MDGASGDPVRAAAGTTRVSLTGIQHPGTGWPTAEPEMVGPAVTGRPHRRDSYPVTVARDNTDADIPTWPFAVGAIAAVAAGALWALRRRSSLPTSPGSRDGGLPGPGMMGPECFATQ